MFKIGVAASTKKLAKETSVYGAGALINKILPVLLLPILTRYLSPEEYGIVAAFSVAVAIANNFVGLNIFAAIQRNYIDNTKEELSHNIGTAFTLIILSMIFWLFILYGFHDFFSKVLSLPVRWLTAIIVVGFFQSIIAIIQVIWRMESKSVCFVSFQAFQSVMNIGLSIVFVVWFLWHWQGRLLGILFSVGLCGLLSTYLLYKNGYLTLRFNKDHAKSMLSFSMPLILYTVSAWVITASDRLFILNMVGAGAVGLYSAGYAIGQIIQLAQHAFSQAWVPFLFESLKNDNDLNKIQIVKFIYFHHIAIIGFVFILNFSAPVIIKYLLGKNFQSSTDYVFWIASSFAFEAMRRMIGPLLNYAKKTHLRAIGAIVAAVTNIFLNYMLIKLYGPIGAAQATFFTFLIFYLITLFYCLKVSEMPWLFWIKTK